MAADRIERALTAVLATATIVLAAIAVQREFFSDTGAGSIRTEAPTVQPAWEDALPVGIRVGDSTSRVTVVVFSDLECPGCAAFHETVWKEVRKQASSDVSMLFVHYPLTGHRFAVQAAQAAECASARGRFESFVDAVYAKQDSLGIKSWGSYAREAGIADTTSIARCARDPRLFQRIQAGRELALSWEVSGTPTVIVNGRRFAHPPTKGEIERVIEDVLKSAAN